MRRELIRLAVGTLGPGELEGIDLATLDARVQSLGLEAHALRTLSRMKKGAGVREADGQGSGGRVGPDAGAGPDVGIGSNVEAGKDAEPRGPEADRIGAGDGHFEDPLLQSWMKELRERVRAGAARNERADEWIRELVRRLAANEVPVMALKGSAIRRVVPGMGGRPVERVALMVPRDRLAVAEALLEEVPYRKEDLTVELHWRPTDDVPPGIVERCWAGSRSLDEETGSQSLDEETGMRVMAPGHRVLFGAVHAARLALDGELRQLADLALEFPLEDREAEVLAEEARAWPPRMVHGPLWLLARWGVPVPAALAERSQVRWWEAGLSLRVLERVVAGDGLAFLPHHRLVSAAHRWLARSGSMTASLLHTAERLTPTP